MLKIIRCEILSLILHNIYSISTSKVVENAKKINSKLPHTNSYSMIQHRNFSDIATPNITNINSNGLKEFIVQNEALIIDVRTKEELAATGVIPNSHNIPLDELSTAFELTPDDFYKKYNIPKPNKNVSIVFSCAKGIRSLKASRYIADLGYKNIFNYTEGWFGWESQKTK